MAQSLAKDGGSNAPIHLHMHSNPDTRQGVRTIKMLRPVCETVKNEANQVIFVGCQDPTKIHSEWWKTCTHDPYTSTAELREVNATFDEQPDGRRKISGSETIVWSDTQPNLAQVALSIRINNGRGVEHARNLGYLAPEEKGYAPFCQFVDCWSQDLAVRGSHGDYCTELQGKLIAADENEDKLEVLDVKKRARQMASISTD